MERAVGLVVRREHGPINAVASGPNEIVEGGDPFAVGGIPNLGQALAQPHPLAHGEQVRDRIGMWGRKHAEGESSTSHTGRERRRFRLHPGVVGASVLPV